MVFIGQDIANIVNINNIGPILFDTRVIFLINFINLINFCLRYAIIFFCEITSIVTSVFTYFNHRYKIKIKGAINQTTFQYIINNSQTILRSQTYLCYQTEGIRPKKIGRSDKLATRLSTKGEKNIIDVLTIDSFFMNIVIASCLRYQSFIRKAEL